MLLARWTHRAMQNPVKFWGAIAAVVAVMLGVAVLSNVMGTGSSANAEVWSKLEAVKSPADRVQVAEEYPGTTAAMWARLEAATEYYNQGFADLPNNRDVALPNLQKAIANFDEVFKNAPKDSPQARAAALGKARALEARNELSKAIEQYEVVAKTYAGTSEAEQARKLADALKRPEAASFYKSLYAYSPSKVTLPPLGTQNLDMPLLPSPGATKAGGLPFEDPSGGLLPSMPLLPPPPPSPLSKGAAAPAKAADAGKSAPAAASGPSPAGLPENPFISIPAAPAASPSAAKKAESKSDSAAPKTNVPK